jgi:valyl-tRNA synthetase
LWPFSTMGWPEKTDLLGTFYPTATLVTAFDILFFWVARMMMMGIHFMGEVPFRDVYVHALVRDENGKKMSKSTGNVIDPLVVIDQYGTDAFRFTLAAFAAQGRDIKMSEKRVEGYRHFINKLWNAARFALMHLDRGFETLSNTALSLPDRWILSRLARVTHEVETALDEYKFNEAAGAVYQFVWHEFCDWYLEAVKPALYGSQGEGAQESAKKTLWFVMRDILVLLHPFTPFVTEEIWDKLPGTAGSIMRASYPDQSAYLDGDPQNAEAEDQMALVIDIITGVRNVRGEMNLPPAKPLAASLQCESEASATQLNGNKELIVNLARLTTLDFITEAQKPKTAATAIVKGAVLYVDLEGVVDVAKEIKRLEKEIAKATKEVTGVARKLGNEDFLAKAPAEVVAKNKERHAALIEKQEKLEITLGRLRAMEG